MAVRTMREVAPSEVPVDGGTAVQDDPGRPVFRGNGADDWVCVKCGTLLAAGMDARVHDAAGADSLWELPHDQHLRRGAVRAGSASATRQRP